tara:strand:- start:89 stop:1726 length:1638 start_codon:yes stop_codon:yes gene_type:complete
MEHDTPKQQTKQPFYERNDHVLNHPTVNCYFENLLDMNDKDFAEWVKEFRAAMIYSWDNFDCPAKSGRIKKQIVKSFNKLTTHHVHKFEHVDELEKEDPNTPHGYVILNKARAGTEADQFFPTMMKSKIHANSNYSGYSVYNMLKEDRFENRMITGSNRHYKRDSFYHYSLTIKNHNKKSAIVDASCGLDWAQLFHDNRGVFKEYDFWLSEVQIKTGKSTGYYPVEQEEYLALSADQLEKNLHIFTKRQLSNIDTKDIKDDCIYQIRLFKLKQKIFPKAFTGIKIGYIQVAVNFPPMTAKFLYEKYTEHIKDQPSINIYDPSSGWGGRILGAMSVSDDRRINYIGNDPNTDNVLDDDAGITRYEYLAKFFNNTTIRGNKYFSVANTFEIFTEGSEEIWKNPRFQKYKGKLDLVFSSPPYFNREEYSADETQSCHKFTQYKDWRDGFLIPTLETCAAYLKPNRYLLWNIADILVEGKTFFPLEQDSIDCLESVGLKYVERVKMCLASMPGQNRLDENGKPKAKNFCKVKGEYQKYEPILVFKKDSV